MPTTPDSILVLGLGNVLCGDDGVGVIAVDWLARRTVLPAHVQVLDGGTLGLALLPLLTDARTVILVDAVLGDGPPGTLVRLEGHEVAPAVAGRLSPHQVGVADLLDGARWLDRLPRELVLVGLVPRTIELGVGCSPEVGRQIPALVDAVLLELERLGCARVVMHDAGMDERSAGGAVDAGGGMWARYAPASALQAPGRS